MSKKDEVDLPDPTQVAGAPHPRDTLRLVGQARAEAGFLEAFSTGRMHHGWLLTGPRGVGKATLAWRIARFLLTQPADDGGLFGAPPPPASLDTDPEHPVCRRIYAGSEPGVFVLKRGANATGTGLSQDIRVDEVRKLKSFLHLSATEGGRRIVIVDSADEMNTQAANALLKLLEEPPARVTFLLISHQPAGLLPTIRSRCRELRLDTLAPDAMAEALLAAEDGADLNTAALATLSGGSVGEAIRLLNLDGLASYEKLVALFSTLPQLDRVRALAVKIVHSASSPDEAFRRLLKSRAAFARVSGGRVEIREVHCPLRVYGRLVVPAGRYRTVRIVLGGGEGRNWWCVLYPDLCGTNPLEVKAIETDEPVVFYSDVMRWVEAMRGNGS